MKKSFITIGLFGFLFSAIVGCKKFVDIDPPISSTTGESVYKDDITAIAVLTGLYTRISQQGGSSATGLVSLSKRGGLLADELSLWSGASNNDMAYYKNALSSNSVASNGHELWITSYAYIQTCNSAIEGVSSSNSLTPGVKQQLLGEAKFMRAFLYFYLVNLYGEVPLITTSDYEINRIKSRAPKSEVYELIVSDLKEAQQQLSSTFLNGQLKQYTGTSERVRPTTWAATALLARVYLYLEQYNNAETESSKLINNGSLFSLTTLSNAFTKNNSESIWQMQPVNTNGSNSSGTLYWNTEDAKLFVLNGVTPNGANSTHPVYLSPQQLTAFEVGDNRKSTWIGTYTDGTGTYFFPFKYKVAVSGNSLPSEYLVVFRLAEQYLIRAEARAKQNNLSGAIADIDIIRQRAGLPLLSVTNPGINQSALVAAIIHERQVELFTEWGHRWLDLKRTSNVNAVMAVITPLKANGSAWQSYQQLFPIPIDDINKNPNLVQNQGY